MPLLEVNKVCKEFGGLMASNQVSFEVNEGEIVSVIGPNGAGKTTAFNIVTGIYTAHMDSVPMLAITGQVALD